MKRKGAARMQSSSSLQDEVKPHDNQELGDLSIEKEDGGDAVKTEETVPDETVPDELDSLKEMEQSIQQAGIKELGATGLLQPPAESAEWYKDTGTIPKWKIIPPNQGDNDERRTNYDRFVNPNNGYGFKDQNNARLQETRDYDERANYNRFENTNNGYGFEDQNCERCKET